MNAITRFTAGLLLLVCLFPAPASGAEAEEAEAALRISAGEALVYAGRLLDKGELDKAAEIYATLLESRTEAIRLEAAFKLGQISMVQGKRDRAVQLFIGILNRYPGLARVRLELARLYFLDENYEDARLHFELVKGDTSLPPLVQKNVDHFLDAIRRQKNWSLNLGFNLVPDSNINQVSGAGQECIRIGNDLLCRQLEKEKSGLGVKLNASGNYYLKFNKSFGLRNSLGYYATEYSDRQYDDHILYAASGPRFVFDGGELSLQPTYTRRWIGHKEYSQAWGARLDGQLDLDRLLLGAGGSFRKSTYHDSYVNSLLHGAEYSFYFQPRYILSSQSYIQAGLSCTLDETRDRRYASDSWTASLGGYYLFKYGFSVFAEFGLTQSLYQESQYYITSDHFIDSTRRRDTIYDFLLELRTNRFEHLGIRPMLQYNYFKRDSNIWSNDYDRHRINATFEYRF